jgi:hypothetical protein
MSDAIRRTVRTALQVVLGLAAGLPALVHTTGLPSTLPGLGVVLAVAAAVTRLMSLPLVEQLLPSWLRTPVPVSAAPAPLTVVPPTVAPLAEAAPAPPVTGA